MSKFFSMIVASTLSVALSGCCSSCRISSSKQVTTLLGNKWQVDELMGERVDHNMGDSYTIEFDEKKGSAFGRADCNRFFSSFALENKNTISFSTIGSTRMACHDDMSEGKFFNMLQRVNGFIINDGELMLLDKGNVIAVLVTAKSHNNSN